MKKLYSTDDKVLAGHLHSILEVHGIQSWIKNQNLSGAMGELPPIECWPEIWIINDDDFDPASDLLQSVLSPMKNKAPDWVCECGETLEGQYSSCWKCGRINPATDEQTA